jgi:hypothetical protein
MPGLRNTMIASFTNNFIFINTRKTAGTSVEIVLRTWCEGQDICSLILPEDELIRYRYGARPRNFCVQRGFEVAFLTAMRSGDRDLIARTYKAAHGRSRYRNHMSAAKVAAALPELWKTAFRFTVVRHPYERVVSIAHWRLRHSRAHRTETFFGLLDTIIDSGRHLNHNQYLIDGEIGLDAVYRYEEVWDKIAALGHGLGKSVPSPLPTAKVGHRTNKQPASAILTDRQKEKVQKQCRWEFKILGFEP